MITALFAGRAKSIRTIDDERRPLWCGWLSGSSPISFFAKHALAATALASVLRFLGSVSESIVRHPMPTPAPPPGREQLDERIGQIPDDGDGEEDEDRGSEPVRGARRAGRARSRARAGDVLCSITALVLADNPEIRWQAIHAVAQMGGGTRPTATPVSQRLKVGLSNLREEGAK